MELIDDVLVWKHGGPPQPQENDEDMLDFDFSNLPQLPSPPTPLSLDKRVTRFEETVSRGFQRLENRQ